MKIQITAFFFLGSFFLKAQIPIPAPDHIVIVIDENRYYGNVIGAGYTTTIPYLNALVNDPNAALFTQSFGITHPSQPNYIHLFSGSNQGVTNDDTPQANTLPFTTANLGASLLANSKTFGGFAEDMPSAGFTDSASVNYVRRHCPWIDWQNGTTNGIPAALSQPFTSFPTDYTKLPTVSFVIPNLANDMHSPQGSRAAGDTWLKNNLDGYIQWAKTHNSLFILTFDEDDQTAAPNLNQITTMFVGQMVKGGQYSEIINHHNVLRTIEEMYSLPYAGNSANVSAITDCWKANQTITFNSLPTKTIGDPSFPLSATASSGLAVGYSAQANKVTIAGTNVTIVAAGREIIKADQAGNQNYNAAPTVNQSFCINPAKPTINVSNPTNPMPTLVSSASAGNQWFFNGTAITGETNSSVKATKTGDYSVQITIDDCKSVISDNTSLVITGDILTKGSATLYPNPANEYIFIHGANNEINETILLNATGQQTKVELTKDGELLKADIRSLTSGVYVIRVQSNGQSQMLRFIKL